MRHAFIASVPFTLMEAIHFTIIYNLDADVYITKSFSDAENVANRLRKTEVFRNVYLVENVLLEYPITIRKCIHVVINGWKLVKELEGRSYDYGYYNNSGWLINSIFYTGFLKGNRKCKHRFIEHGYSTLLNPYGNKSVYMRILVRLFGFRCMDGTMLEALYMFEPSLLRVHQDGEKRQMPKIDRNNKRFKEAVNTAFGFNAEKNEFSNKKVIIMEEGPQKVKFDKNRFWNNVISLIDTSETIIKPHPRLKESTLSQYGIPICKNNSIPWEVVAINTDMEDKVQLCMFSGSCLHPMHWFGIESRVIMLYKLLPVDYTFLGKDILNFSDDIKELYKDKSKFFVPDTLEELSEYLKKIGVHA